MKQESEAFADEDGETGGDICFFCVHGFCVGYWKFYVFAWSVRVC